MNPFERSAAAAVLAKNGAKTAKSVTKKPPVSSVLVGSLTKAPKDRANIHVEGDESVDILSDANGSKQAGEHHINSLKRSDTMTKLKSAMALLMSATTQQMNAATQLMNAATHLIDEPVQLPIKMPSINVLPTTHKATPKTTPKPTHKLTQLFG